MSKRAASAADERSRAPDDSGMREIRWRCRRGMRELDVLLTRWLERNWGSSDPEMRKGFRRLLDCEDDQLWDWLLGRTTPSDSGLQQIVGAIRSESGPR